MGINEKLIQFVDTLGVSQRKFTAKCGLSEGSLRNGRSVSVESLVKIKKTYPELNLEWILFDKGNITEDPEEGKGNAKETETIDNLVDKKIEKRFEQLKELIGELIMAEIENEIERAKNKKN